MWRSSKPVISSSSKSLQKFEGKDQLLKIKRWLEMVQVVWQNVNVAAAKSNACINVLVAHFRRE
jgi:hypothetical protein